MKKLITGTALGALLVAGFFFTFDNTSDLSMDREPSIYSIGHTSF